MQQLFSMILIHGFYTVFIIKVVSMSKLPSPEFIYCSFFMQKTHLFDWNCSITVEKKWLWTVIKQKFKYWTLLKGEGFQKTGILQGSTKLHSCNGYSRWRKQSYLKQRRQKSVWKECIVCSRGTDSAVGPSILGVHSGGSALGSSRSVSSIYLQLRTA